MEKHPVGVGLVGGVHQFAVGKGGAAAGGAAAVNEDGRAIGFGFLGFGQGNGGQAVGGFRAEGGDDQGVEQGCFDFVGDFRGQGFVLHGVDETGEGAAEGIGHSVVFLDWDLGLRFGNGLEAAGEVEPSASAGCRQDVLDKAVDAGKDDAAAVGEVVGGVPEVA